MEKIFCEEVEKPELSEDTLAHFGVLGMKWHKRKARNNKTGRGTHHWRSQARRRKNPKPVKIEEFDSAMYNDPRYESHIDNITSSKRDTRFYPKAGVDTNRDPRYVRQGNGMRGDPRYENRYRRYRKK